MVWNVPQPMRVGRFAVERMKAANQTLLLTPRCQWIRGSSGHWIADPITIRSRDASVVVNSTNFRWEDEERSCQTSLWTKAGMCQVMNNLGLNRIFLVGDSLTHLQYTSMWNLLGFEYSVKGTEIPNNFTVNCPENLQTSFIIQYVRNDKLSLTKTNRRCVGGICNAWVDAYRGFKDRGKTLLVANTGAHLHSFPTFQSRFDAFVQLLSEQKESQDLIFFRTTVPGHFNCSRSDVPYQDARHFRATLGSDHYDWSLMESYNEYAKDAFQVGCLARRETCRRRLILDVFPMTILRPDGHSNPPVDCLHYLLPGPPDWWNHLLYSNLKDLHTSTSVP